MPSRVRPVYPEEAKDAEVRDILEQMRSGWWVDEEMMGIIARRPELAKTIVPVFAAFFGKGLVEPYIIELMRIKTGNMCECTYCRTVRTVGVEHQTKPKESPLGIMHFSDVDYGKLKPREALAVELAERMALDPHTVDDDFWSKLKSVFTDDEIVELVFAASIFKWGNQFNITMRVDSSPKSRYPKNLTYETREFARRRIVTPTVP